MESLFTIGQKVVCLNSKETDLIEGKVYTVMAIGQCKCGHINLDVGLRLNPNTHVSWCSYCNHEEETFIYWFNQFRFAPVDTDRALENEIHEALKGQKIIV